MSQNLPPKPDSLKGLVHDGNCGCEAGTPVYMDPISYAAFRCAACHRKHLRARVRDRVQPVMMRFPGCTIPLEFELMTASSRCNGIADLVGVGGVVKFGWSAGGPPHLVVETWGEDALVPPDAR